MTEVVDSPLAAWQRTVEELMTDNLQLQRRNVKLLASCMRTIELIDAQKEALTALQASVMDIVDEMCKKDT